MKKFKKIMCTTLATLSLAVCAVTPVSDVMTSEKSFSIITTLDADAASGRLYNQNDSKWKSVTFKGYFGNMKDSGCGIFSFCNALYALNGSKPDAKEVGQWAINVGAFKPGINGTDRGIFYNNVQKAYGSRFGFKLDGQYFGNVKDSRLINHLKKGGVAVIHVPGHFMVITGYNNNGTYHVIESASRLPGDSWQTESRLSSGNTKVDWFVLISKSNPSPAPTPTPTPNYFPKYTGTSNSITDALKAVGVAYSLDYRKSIAEANGIQNYSGKSDQNIKMLNLLKQGKLKKPGSSPTPVVNYFPKYTGKSNSISDALKAVGASYSLDYRKKVATANGIQNYSGKSDQNIKMLNLLKQGKLIKP